MADPAARLWAPRAWVGGRWRDAVQNELAKTTGWTSEDLDYLRFCKPERFLPGGEHGLA